MISLKEEEIKDRLMSSDLEFRRLVKEHDEYEGKLNDLQSHPYWTQKDHLDEVKFKKKKLHVKDQMNSMIQKFRNELSHQAS